MVSRTAILFALAAGLFGGTPTAVAQPTLPKPQLVKQNPNLIAPAPADSQPFGGGVPLDIPGLPATDQFLPDGSPIRVPDVRTRQTIRFSPRYGTLGVLEWVEVEPGTRRLVYTGGVVVNITYPVKTIDGKTAFVAYEFAADNLVAWQKGGSGVPVGPAVTVEPAGANRSQVELYLTGNVVIRSQEKIAVGTGPKDTINRTLRADAVYYDVQNSRAIAMKADMEVLAGRFQDSVHVYADEITRLGEHEWQAVDGGVFSSKLPSDPGIRLKSSRMTYTEEQRPRRNFLGLTYSDPFDRDDGKPTYERTLTGKNTRVTLFDVPVFYTPYLKTDIAEPLGPLQGIGFGSDRVFGQQFYSTFDLYKLIAVRAPAGHSWRLNADLLSDRGVGLGTDYDMRTKSLFGYGGPASVSFRHWGIADGGKDQIGPRPEDADLKKPAYRFRTRYRYLQDLYTEREQDTFLPTGLDVTLQSQFAWVSDKNFLEQYFFQEHAYAANQETFAYLKATDGSYFGSVLAQGGQSRKWLTETQWLPRADGAVIGKSFFDLFVYNARASVGYAQFRPATLPALSELATEQQRVDTGRADLTQELSVPFDLGPVRVAPYGTLSLTGYSKDLTGESAGRVYGGGGVRSSLSLSRVFSEASSDLFNLRGLNHKVTFTGNYFNADSDTPYTRLPLLDRLNDDAIDLGYRSVQPYFKYLVTEKQGEILRNNPRYDPQRYAIRRLLGNNVDTRDDIEIVQLGVDQRLQTKRGFQGNEHTVDFLTLNVGVSLFPNKDRDNFGRTAGLLDYFFLWNAGDRTAVQSSGWFDPYDPGVRYYNVGVYLNRPDRTNFFFGYRQTDPVNSKAVMGGVYYSLSSKYSMSFDAAYDFGTQQAISNTFTLTRTGKDLTVSVGLSYNAIVNNFGFQFSILPNLASGTRVAGFGTPRIGGQ